MESNTSFLCSKCPKTFPHKRNLVRHVTSVHVENKFVCDSCGKTSSREDLLKRHKLNLAINAPEQVRNDGNFYKYLKLEQETERAHAILNKLEVRYEASKTKLINISSCLKHLKICKRLIPPLCKPSILLKKVIKNYLFSLKFIIM